MINKNIYTTNCTFISIKSLWFVNLVLQFILNKLTRYTITTLYFNL